MSQLYVNLYLAYQSIQSTKEMEVEHIKFDKELYRFLNMAIQIWPSFKSGMKHLTQVQQPSPESFLPKKNYSVMTQVQFAQTIADDLFEFIMEHDVKEEDIQDYLYDILDLLMIDEQLSGTYKNPASVQYMSNYTMGVIKQLQEGKNNLVVAFEQNIYLNVKQFKGEIVQSKQNNSEQDEDSDQNYQSDSVSDQDCEQKQKEKEVKKKSEQQLKKQQQLEDDGWIIVRK